MPVKKFPLRRTLKHCTTGSVPITVHASRVVPVELKSEWEFVDFTDRIFGEPGLRRLFAFACAIATHAGLSRQPWRFRTIAFASPFVSASTSASSSSRSTFSAEKNLANRPLIARNRMKPTTISANRFRSAEHTGHLIPAVRGCNRISALDLAGARARFERSPAGEVVNELVRIEAIGRPLALASKLFVAVIPLPSAIALGALFWLWTPHVLLGKRIPLHRLIPTGFVTTAAITLYSVGTAIFLPDIFTNNAERYGLIGIAFGLVTWLFAYAAVVIVSAVVGGTWDRRRQQAQQRGDGA